MDGLATAVHLAVVTTWLAACSSPPPPVDGSIAAKEYTCAEYPDVEYVYPKEVSRSYTDAMGNEHVYMAQIPEELTDKTAILIYLHGAGSKEQQGMGHESCKATFERLRTLMTAKGWLYVSPRDYEQPGLIAHLKKEYGSRPVYLAGPSAGGKAVLQAALKTPDAYAGLIVMCPAWHFSRGGMEHVEKLGMPIVLVSGEKDGIIAPFCRDLAATLTRHNPNVVFAEIPGAGHGGPLKQIVWERAVEYVASRSEP